MRPAFGRTEPWLQAGKYVTALMSDLPRRNGWTIARFAGDRSPDRTQRLLNRAAWDQAAAMGAVRRFAADGLDQAAARRGRRSLSVGALDETGQEKHGSATAGVQRQHMGCAGGVENGINTVHLSYVREHAGHALIGARQRIPADQIADPVRSLVTGLPPDLEFQTKGELAIGLVAEAAADGITMDFVCGDERQPSGMTRLIRAAGLHWPVEEDFEFAKDGFGLDQSQVRLYHAIARHTVLVTAALAICAVTAALVKDPAPDQLAAPGQQRPPALRLIPLTVPEVRRLLTATTARIWPPGHIEHWSAWMRTHQARARWHHQRARLERDQEIIMKPLAA